MEEGDDVEQPQGCSCTINTPCLVMLIIITTLFFLGLMAIY